MRYIRNISDNQNKSGDTDSIFRFNLLQGEDIFNFGDYPISINIANSSGYILSMVPEKEFGNSVLKLDFNDQSLKSLTPDNYLLEVEVKFPDGTTATFPTKGGMPFSVNSNLKNTAGQLVPTVTFDEVLNAVDEKVNNYLATVVKGDKGDTGVVDTAKDYTWTGTNTFTGSTSFSGGIKGGQVNLPASGDLNTLTDTGKYYQNTSVNAQNWSNRPSNAPNLAFSVDVIGQANRSLATQVFYVHTTSRMWVRTMWLDGTNIVTSQWAELANDNNVVHNTGTETIAGDKTFTGNNNFSGSTKFAKPIQGGLGVRSYPLTTIAALSGKLIEYSGKWGVTGLTDLPQGGYAILTVYPYIDNASSGFVTLQYTNGNFYFSDINGSNVAWKKVAKDNETMHLTGDETASGFKKFSGNISTTSDNSMINGGGNNGDIALVKKSGTSGALVVGKNNSFAVKQDANASILPTGAQTTFFNVNTNGTIYAGTQQDLVPLDKNVVHNTGAETVGGDKTFSGNAIFNNAISGKFKNRQLTNGTDLYKLIEPGINYTSTDAQVSSFINKPSGVTNAFGIIGFDVTGYNNGIWSNTQLLLFENTTGRIFTALLTSDNTGVISVLKQWTKIATDDSFLVHNTGTETVAGDKAFTGNNTFTGKNTFTGQTSFWFKQIQWTSGIMQGTWYIQRIGNWVNAKFDMSANTSTGTTTLTLPVGYRPLSSFVRELEQDTAGIAKAGTVFISQAYIDSNAMTFSYPTNDPWPTA